MIAHVIECYANEMKSGGGQGDQDPDDQPMEIGEHSLFVISCFLPHNNLWMDNDKRHFFTGSS